MNLNCLSLFLQSVVSLLLICSFSVSATPKEELSKRLALNDGFSADFSQQVFSPEGEMLIQGKGKVEIARPSLFRWETTEPDENLLISDGKTLWYYSPFIEQVSIYWQEQAVQQTPFVLLTRNQSSDWDQYKVLQQLDTFILTPTAVDSNQGQFQMEIDRKGMVKQFIAIEQDGQKSQFMFSNFMMKRPPTERFQFIIPAGVEVDDQRN